MRNDSCLISIAPTVTTVSLRTAPATPSLMAHFWSIGILLLILSTFSTLSLAHPLTPKECAEGSDFIKNAALARDGGMSEIHFTTKIRDDIEILRAFPPQLRWFVQDEEDAQFLFAAIEKVFRDPKDPLVHQGDFMKACMRNNGDKPLRQV